MSESIKTQRDNEASFFDVLTSRSVLHKTKSSDMRYFCLHLKSKSPHAAAILENLKPTI